MKRLSLLLAGSFLVFAALACGDGEPERFSADPGALLDQAQAAMAGLESYHTAFSFSTQPDDAQGDGRWEVAFAAPDSYRIRVFGAGGESANAGECESYIGPDGLSRGETCREVSTGNTGSTLLETVYVADTIYSRQCEDIETACGPWREQTREPLVMAGPSGALAPGWPLVAMEMAGEFEFVSQDKTDGVALTHIRGSVNHIRAVLENQRRVLTAAGITSFGRWCTTIAMNETGSLFESAPGTPVENDEICREQTFEESLESQEPGLSFYDENRAVIDVWVSPDDFLVHRVALSIPPDEANGAEISFVMEYSLFNQVEIEAPG